MTAGQATSPSSPEENDGDPNNNSSSYRWPGSGNVSGDVHTSGDENDASNAEGGGPNRAPAPVRKRRRVTRACDECRRKKIKCDGKQPCTHCTVYSYECTYDQPSNRRRNPAPQYIEAIENRLRRAEALLKTLLPNVDLNDPELGIELPQLASTTLVERGGENARARPRGENHEAEVDSLLETMVEHTGSLDLDDQGQWDFHGHSSGMVFLQRLRQQLGDIMGEAEGYGSAMSKPRHFTPPSQVFESPRSTDSASDSFSPIPDLPPKSIARQHCETAISDACAILRFIHAPTFFATFDQIYDVPPEQWGNEQHRNLPLLYSLMAVGSMFSNDENGKLSIEGYGGVAGEGYKFFRAARQLMDITEIRDLPALQAILCMILFLQSSAKLSTCWSYIGIALHSAIRMGLHRSITGNFNPVESEVRKRLFWQIRKMDTYVGAMLGLPTMLGEDDIDQEFPAAIDDEFITTHGIKPMPPGRVPLMSACNEHTKLLKILQKINRYVYPVKQVQHANKAHTYLVSHSKIREIERDLQEWMERLPLSLRPGGDTSPRLERVQQLLRISYAYLQIFLYRPFLHYVSKNSNQSSVDKRSFACAAACVSVSRNVVHITSEMSRRGLLVGAYWFVMYTTFIAVISIVFFILENPESSTSKDLLKDAIAGKEILDSLSRGSMAADRCSATLGGLFEQLPERLKSARRGKTPDQTPKKKRPAGSPNRASVSAAQGKSNAALTGKNQQWEHAIPQRASTFPNNAHQPVKKSRTFPAQDPNQNPNLSAPQIDFDSDLKDLGAITTSSPNPNGDSMSYNYLGMPGFASSAEDSDAIPDLTAMMFPSTDPFAYPRPPMITIENNKFLGPQSSGLSSGSNFYASPQSQGSFDTSSEAQFYDPLQPYLTQAAQTQPQPQRRGSPAGNPSIKQESGAVRVGGDGGNSHADWGVMGDPNQPLPEFEDWKKLDPESFFEATQAVGFEGS